VESESEDSPPRQQSDLRGEGENGVRGVGKGKKDLGSECGRRSLKARNRL